MLKALLLSLNIWLGPTDTVETVEINTFGDQPRTAILYRDGQNQIIDWRWYTCPEQIPERIRTNSTYPYMAIWNDMGKPRIIYCRTITYIRSLNDRELDERTNWPEVKRRKLSR